MNVHEHINVLLRQPWKVDTPPGEIQRYLPTCFVKTLFRSGLVPPRFFILRGGPCGPFAAAEVGPSEFTGRRRRFWWIHRFAREFHAHRVAKGQEVALDVLFEVALGNGESSYLKHLTCKGATVVTTCT